MPSDIADVNTNEKTGEESYLTWMDSMECEIDVRKQLDQAL